MLVEVNNKKYDVKTVKELVDKLHEDNLDEGNIKINNKVFKNDYESLDEISYVDRTLTINDLYEMMKKFEYHDLSSIHYEVNIYESIEELLNEINLSVTSEYNLHHLKIRDYINVDKLVKTIDKSEGYYITEDRKIYKN